MKPGLKAEIKNSAFNKNFKGIVESISSTIDPSTRSILARIIVDNSNFEIIPGQLMTVKVIYDETNQIGIPETIETFPKFLLPILIFFFSAVSVLTT